jgi:hypothetical protein
MATTRTRATAKSKAPAKRGVTHHAKRLFHLTPKFVHGMAVGGLVGLVTVLTLRAVVPVSALSIVSPRDCDNNAVMNCGALTTTELQTKYSNAGVASIYNYFGISAAEVKSMSSTAVSGLVYKDGTVKVNNTTVATGAVTAGRLNISGSTKVTSGGITFYKREPKVSFRPNYIAAYVVMKDGVFQHAILAACGNPVIATPVKKSIPKPPTTPTTPEAPPETPTPPSTQTPESTPTPVVTTAAAAVTTPTELPHTGPGAVGLVAVLSVVGGYLFHVAHRHVRYKRRAHHAMR